MVLRVLLVDDHPIVREGLRTLLNSEPDLCVVGEADNGREAIVLAQTLLPDVIVLDISMPSLDGAHAAPLLKEACPQAAILVLTVYEDALRSRELLALGASGYVLKSAAGEAVISALRVVASGGIYIDPRVGSPRIMGDGTGRRAASAAPLSERETEVLRAIALGYSNKEIATRFELSVRTVETYKARSMEKLGLRNRVDIVRYATERQWLR